MTGDIYLVSQLMGHGSITTTEIYAKFLSSRLLEDFPDLTGFAENWSNGRMQMLNRGHGALIEKQSK